MRREMKRMSAQRRTTRMRMSDADECSELAVSQIVVSGDAITRKQNKNRCGLKNG